MSERSIRKNNIRRYIFPKMPVGTVRGEKLEASGKNAFQRIHFDDRGRLFFDAEQIVNSDAFANLQEEVEKTEEQAYTKGFEKGEKDGFEVIKDRFNLFLNKLHEAILDLERTKNDILISAEREAVELALAIARKIVCHEVQTDRNVILNVIKEALRKVVEPTQIVIKVSSEDLKFINNSDSDIQNLIGNFDNVSFVEDDKITNGGCVIETNLGDIDARIENQLFTLEEAFKTELNKLRFGG